MSDQCSNGAFGEAEVVRRAGEAMAKDVGGEAGKFIAVENPVPLIGEAAESLRSTNARKHELTLYGLAPLFEQFDDR